MTCRATASAEYTETASKSPPNAWPQVTVASMRPRSRSVGDEVRECERQRGAVGHDVGEPRVGSEVLERDRDRGELAVQRGGDDRHAVDRVDVGQLRVEVLLGAAHVGLQARVPGLDDVAGTLLGPRGPREVPVHDVPAAGTEPELDRGRVHDDVVALGHRSRSGRTARTRAPVRTRDPPRPAAAPPAPASSATTRPVRNEGIGRGYRPAPTPSGTLDYA